ncbi:hypothetical protein [Mesorhizobium carmichaelinearum]|uniref:hypothetical protein n=1 Tax=Mesorhizobium carmichaelinearum TaxID=1208188 RepID=UPI0015C842ED|nr:hypothetical protein [Mesorhizobium carmichaelinearum]
MEKLDRRNVLGWSGFGDRKGLISPIALFFLTDCTFGDLSDRPIRFQPDDRLLAFLEAL